MTWGKMRNTTSMDDNADEAEVWLRRGGLRSPTHSRYAYSFRYVSLNPMKDRQMSWTAARRLLLDGPARWGAGTRCGRSTVRWSRSGNAVGCDVLRSGPCSWDGETQERSIRPKFCILWCDSRHEKSLYAGQDIKFNSAWLFSASLANRNARSRAICSQARGRAAELERAAMRVSLPPRAGTPRACAGAVASGGDAGVGGLVDRAARPPLPTRFARGRGGRFATRGALGKRAVIYDEGVEQLVGRRPCAWSICWSSSCLLWRHSSSRCRISRLSPCRSWPWTTPRRSRCWSSSFMSWWRAAACWRCCASLTQAPGAEREHEVLRGLRRVLIEVRLQENAASDHYVNLDEILSLGISPPTPAQFARSEGYFFLGRLGQMMAEQPKDLGGRPTETGFQNNPVKPLTLVEAGIDKKQSTNWHKRDQLIFAYALPCEPFHDATAR